MTQLIFVEQEPMAGKERIPQPGATIGREGCDINLPDPEASRRHAVVREVDGGLAIEDLGSTNGTLVNGQRIRGITPLKAGDLLQIGNTKLRVQSPSQATQAGGAPVGGATPQVTAARQVPQEQPPAQEAPPAPAPAPAPPAQAVQATAAQSIPQQQPPAAPRPPAPAPPQPATPLGGGGERRGDVPRPDFAPSVVRRAVPPPTGKPQFNAPQTVRPGGGSAATRLEATAFAFAVTLLTLVGVVAYYVTKPFE